MGEFCKNKKSSLDGRYPTDNGAKNGFPTLETGEIGVNFYAGNEFLTIVNTNNKIVEYRPWSYIENQINKTVVDGYRTVMAFKSSVEKPLTPVGGKWNDIENKMIYPTGWGESDNLERPIWMSVGQSNPNTSGFKWSEPTMISGNDGKNGTDGIGAEFIYKLSINMDDKPSKPTENENKQDFIPKGWTDSPSGIDENHLVEWVCTRKYNSNDKQWGDWDGPTIWAKWGVNGIDGDGVEYIYYLNDGKAVDNPTPENWETDEIYQDKEIEFIPEGWKDEPIMVTVKETHCWVCTRKYRNGRWGEYSNPSIWAMYGIKGDTGADGISMKSMFTTTTQSNIVPPFALENNNPGSAWSSKMPTTGDFIWEIWSYVKRNGELADFETTNDKGEIITIKGWQGPILKSGIPGTNGNVPNYKAYFYKISETKPAQPTTGDTLSDFNFNTEGWEDFPTSEGKWWQCIATVDGNSDIITDWSEVFGVNTGEKGENGGFTEFRFRVHSSRTEAPTLRNKNREPKDWSITVPTVTESSPYMWMATAQINSDNTLNGKWNEPICITGEQGPKGGDGPAGLPGPGVEVRYSLGNGTIPNANTPQADDTSLTPEGWSVDVPTVTEEFLYVWCIQSTKAIYDNDNNIVGRIWSKPLRLSGLNGLDGKNGGGSQIVYPAGIYDESVAYTTTDKVAPYVFYDGDYYVLNTIMTWVGIEQNNVTPKDDNGQNWQKFESFKAMYASVGIVDNGRFGDAVFNSGYMFSQNGIGDGNFEDFNPDDPYGDDATFKPAWCVNLKDGRQWCSYGQIEFGIDNDTKICINTDKVKVELSGENFIWDNGTATFTLDGEKIQYVTNNNKNKPLIINKNGSGELANGNITWDENGNGTFVGGEMGWNGDSNNTTNFFMKEPFTPELKKDKDGYYELPFIPSGYTKTYHIPFINSDDSQTIKFKTNDSVQFYTNSFVNNDCPHIIGTTITKTISRKGVGYVVCLGVYQESTNLIQKNKWYIGIEYFGDFKTTTSTESQVNSVNSDITTINSKIVKINQDIAQLQTDIGQIKDLPTYPQIPME